LLVDGNDRFKVRRPRKSGQELSYDCGGRGRILNPNSTTQKKAKRRRHDPEFKACVALETIKGIQPIQQIAKDFERQRDELHAKIEQLTVEVDFLRKSRSTSA
jgi:hypothetical protein